MKSSNQYGETMKTPPLTLVASLQKDDCMFTLNADVPKPMASEWEYFVVWNVKYEQLRIIYTSYALNSVSKYISEYIQGAGFIKWLWDG